MKRNNIIFGILIGLVVCLTASLSMTYARYVTNLGDVEDKTVEIARWNFATDNVGSTIYTYTLDNTYDSSTLTNGKIAPGTSGKIEFNLANSSDVAADYEIIVTIPTYPTNLVVYAYEGELTTNTRTVLATGDKLTGTMPLDTAEHKRTIYWEWPYETDGENADTTDTVDGQSTNHIDNNFEFEVNGYQSQVFETGANASELKTIAVNPGL